ncbi:glycosyltransferase family 4 protein [Flavobacterium chuncheonense]|uniref:Glycosyltransferase family 4 protein n=1 Tax=Flavobacterium chuncheonense TaxID=2026653 RepID=A0ABW5YQA2_9FLAO
MKNKILLESHNLNNLASGLGTFNFELIKAISNQNIDDLDIVLNIGNITKFKQIFGNKFSYKQYFTFQRYPMLYTRQKFNLWHSLNQNIKLEPHHKSKYILTVHDVNFFEEISNDYNHKRNKLFVEKIKRADKVVYISEFAKEQTHQYFDLSGKEESIIYNGNPVFNLLDTNNISSDFLKENDPFFFSIGDFIERKNFEAIVKMMSHFNDYKLIIAGNNTKKYGEVIRNLIIERKLENKVFLAGKISNELKQFYLKNCSAFLFPSIREGFGLPPIEAMRFQKPVFLSKYTSLPEIGGDAAFYWDNFDEIEMKEKVISELNYFENNKSQMEEKLLKRALYFSWDKAAEEYLKLYRQTLNL